MANKVRELTPDEVRPQQERLPLNVRMERQFAEARQRDLRGEVFGYAMWCLKNALAAFEYLQEQPDGEWSRARGMVTRELLLGTKDSALELAAKVPSSAKPEKEATRYVLSVSSQQDAGGASQGNVRDAFELKFPDLIGRVPSPKPGVVAEQLVAVARAALEVGDSDPLTDTDLHGVFATVSGLRDQMIPPTSFIVPRDPELTVRAWLRFQGWPPSKIRSAFSAPEKRGKRRSKSRRTK